MKTRIWIIVAFVSALIAVPAIARGTEEEGGLPEEVVIGYQAIPNGEIIAKDKGWHEESFGVPVRWVQIESGRELNTALAAGSVDLGLGGSSTTVAGIVQGLPAEVFWIYDIIGENEALVVRKESGIETASDLVGKRVAAPFGATTHYHLLVALQVNNVPADEVTILDMQPPDMLAAWQRGDIDAGFVWEPTLAKMLELGGKVLISSGELAAKGYVTGDIGFVHRNFAERYPKLVELYLKNQIRAIELYRSDPNAAAESIAAQFQIPAAEARRQIDSLVLLDDTEQLGASYMGTSDSPGELARIFRNTADFLVSQGIVDETPDLQVFVDAINPEYLERAVADAAD